MPISVNKTSSMFDDPMLAQKMLGINSGSNQSKSDAIGSGELISNEYTGDVQPLIESMKNKGNVVVDKEKEDDYEPSDFGHSVVPAVMKRVRKGTKESIENFKNVSDIIEASRRRIGAISPLKSGHLWLIAYGIDTGEITTDDEIDELVKSISTGELHPELTNPEHPDYAKAMEMVEKGLVDENGNYNIEETEYNFDSPTSGTYTTTESNLRSDVVEILINATQLGDVMNALANEKDKIEFARRVRIVTTERRDVSSSTSRTKISASELYKRLPPEIKPITYTMVLPASRYRITLKSLSYAQIISLGLQTENATYEDYNRRYSTIYDAIVDTSIGKFSSYEDFMKKTAWEDTTLLMYTLAGATLSTENVTVTCPTCGTKATITYDVKSLVDWSSVPDATLLAYKKTSEVQSEESISENYSHNVLNTTTIYELPSKKCMVEFGGISIYDFMNKMSDYVVAEKAQQKINDLQMEYKMGLRSSEMKSKWDTITQDEKDTYLATLPDFDDNSKVIYALIFSMLSVVNKVIVPIDDEEFELDSPDDIIDYLYSHLEPIDMEVLSKLYIDRIAIFQQRYRVPGDHICSNGSCKQKLTISIDPNDDLIFPQASRLTNSEYVLSR